MRLKNKVALITGAARGIGLCFAQAFADEGAKVIIADIDIARATASAAAIGPSVKAVKLDVTDLSEIDAVVKAVDEEFGGIDILVNNAAIFDMAPINGITEQSYERVFDINGFGLLQFSAIVEYDEPVIMGVVFVSAVLMLLGNVLSDLCVALVDPRVSYK